jgi:hypothetical protein
MGLIDRLKGKVNRTKKEFDEAKEPYRAEQRAKYEEESAAKRDRERARIEKEDRDYKKREAEAKRRAEQNRIREIEVANKEKQRQLRSRDFKAGIGGTLSDIAKHAVKQEKPARRQRGYRRSRPRYDNYYQPRYQAPPRRSTIDSVDREFDKFF